MLVINFDFFSSPVSLLSFLIFFIHWIVNKKPSLPNFLFRVFLFSNAYLYFVSSIIQSGGIKSVPHLYRTGSIGGFLIAPLLYLIIIKSLKNAAWKKRDWLHFIPALLYTINFLPFFVLNSEAKLNVLNHLSMTGASVGFSEGFLPGELLQLLRFVQLFLYSLISFLTVRRITSNSGSDFRLENKKLIVLLYWLSIYIFINAVVFILLVLHAFGTFSLDVATMVGFVSTCITCIYLLLNPDVLYGLKGIWTTAPSIIAAFAPNSAVIVKQEMETVEQPMVLDEELTEADEPEVTSQMKVRKIYLNEAQVENLQASLEQYMRGKENFIQPGFSLPQMAQDTGYSLQSISAFLNQHAGENFNDYINRFRIEYLIRLYQKDKEKMQLLTLESIANMVGFRSRSTFIKAFKKNTDKTPSSFFKNL